MLEKKFWPNTLPVLQKAMALTLKKAIGIQKLQHTEMNKLEWGCYALYYPWEMLLTVTRDGLIIIC